MVIIPKLAWRLSCFGAESTKKTEDLRLWLCGPQHCTAPSYYSLPQRRENDVSQQCYPLRAAKARQGAHYSRLVHEMPARAHNGTVQVSITLSMTWSHAKSIHGYGIIMTTAASFPRSPALHGVDVCTESVQSAGGEHYTRLHHTPSRRIVVYSIHAKP